MSESYWNTHSGPHYQRKAKTLETKRRCHLCSGSGMAPCQICSGKGEVLLGRDHNNRPRFIRCEGCYGKKTRRCGTCNGEGFA